MCRGVVDVHVVGAKRTCMLCKCRMHWCICQMSASMDACLLAHVFIAAACRAPRNRQVSVSMDAAGRLPYTPITLVFQDLRCVWACWGWRVRGMCTWQALRASRRASPPHTHLTPQRPWRPCRGSLIPCCRCPVCPRAWSPTPTRRSGEHPSERDAHCYRGLSWVALPAICLPVHSTAPRRGVRAKRPFYRTLVVALVLPPPTSPYGVLRLGVGIYTLLGRVLASLFSPDSSG